jgi:hypothetical protein
LAVVDLFLFCFSVFVWIGWRWRAWKIWAQEETKKTPSDWRREASIATEGKPNLSFSLCLLGSIKYIPSGTTLLCLSQEGVGVLSALLRF